MEAIILAAGRGSRLGATTDNMPKCMVPLAGKPLIQRCLDRLRQAGIGKITVVSGYRGENLPDSAVNIVRNGQWASTGIAYSMLCAADQVSGPAIICYSDIVFELRVLQALMGDRRRGIAIAVNTGWLTLWNLRMGDVLSDAESLRRTADWQITEIGQPAQSVADIQGQFMGLIRLGRSALPALADLYRQALQDETCDGEPASQWDMTTLLTRWLRSGRSLSGVPVSGGWLEVDTTTDLDLYERLQRTGQLSAICQLD
jgi:L-glutamine-phosphate cytidylyltransferase